MFKGISIDINPSDEKKVEEYWAKIEQQKKADAFERYKVSGVPAKLCGQQLPEQKGRQEPSEDSQP